MPLNRHWCSYIGRNRKKESRVQRRVARLIKSVEKSLRRGRAPDPRVLSYLVDVCGIDMGDCSSPTRFRRTKRPLAREDHRRPGYAEVELDLITEARVHSVAVVPAGELKNGDTLVWEADVIVDGPSTARVKLPGLGFAVEGRVTKRAAFKPQRKLNGREMRRLGRERGRRRITYAELLRREALEAERCRKSREAFALIERREHVFSVPWRGTMARIVVMAPDHTDWTEIGIRREHYWNTFPHETIERGRMLATCEVCITSAPDGFLTRLAADREFLKAVGTEVEAFIRRFQRRPEVMDALDIEPGDFA